MEVDPSLPAWEDKTLHLHNRRREGRHPSADDAVGLRLAKWRIGLMCIALISTLMAIARIHTRLYFH